MRIGIIGGTGVYELGEEVGTRSEQVATPYGSVDVGIAEHAGRELVFIPRHGPDHSIPPHRINYLANVDALRRTDCGCVIATHAVGSIHPAMEPGDIVLPDQFIDFTKSRPFTFFEGGGDGVRHVDVTEPYCPALRECTLEALSGHPSAVHSEATLVCTEGPRFETPAEIRMFERLGGDIVGMTGVPEVVLAREAGMCYMSVCVVTNFAAGVKGVPLTEGEVTAHMRARLDFLRGLVLTVSATAPVETSCNCRL